MGSRVIGMGWLARLARGDDGGVTIAARRGATGNDERGWTTRGDEFGVGRRGCGRREGGETVGLLPAV